MQCKFKTDLANFEAKQNEGYEEYKQELEDRIDNNQDKQVCLFHYLEERYPQFEVLRTAILQIDSEMGYNSLYEVLDHILTELEDIDYNGIDGE